MADKGRQVTVTGPIAVTTGERTELRVTVTQRSTGAVAEGIIFFTGSGRLKQDVCPYEPGLNELLQLRPVLFLYRDDAKRGLTSDHEEVGFIAQEIRWTNERNEMAATKWNNNASR